MLGLVTLLTIGFLLCFISPKKRLESMTDVSHSKGCTNPKLPSLAVIVSKLSSFDLKQYLLEAICGEIC